MHYDLQRGGACGTGCFDGAGISGSIDSAKNFPTIPIECKPSANTPGNAPNPTAATKIIPMINSGIARRPFNIPRAI
jgi:hypothetical protein